jgi:hypothetical protein
MAIHYIWHTKAGYMLMEAIAEDYITLARNFVKAVEEGRAGDELDEFFAAGALQTQFPNELSRSLVTRSLNDIKDSSLKGKSIIMQQQFEIKNALQAGNTVLLELVWTGTLAVPIGKKSPGSQLKAYFAQIFEFENGKIIRQRNYDCFEPL